MGDWKRTWSRRLDQPWTNLQASRCGSHTIYPQYPGARFPPTNFARDGWSG
jgi:hypothetical protein